MEINQELLQQQPKDLISLISEQQQDDTIDIKLKWSFYHCFQTPQEIQKLNSAQDFHKQEKQMEKMTISKSVISLMRNNFLL